MNEAANQATSTIITTQKNGTQEMDYVDYKSNTEADTENNF